MKGRWHRDYRRFAQVLRESGYIRTHRGTYEVWQSLALTDANLAQAIADFTPTSGAALHGDLHITVTLIRQQSEKKPGYLFAALDGFVSGKTVLALTSSMLLDALGGL